MAWIRTQAVSDKLPGEDSRRPVTSHFLDLLVARGSSLTTQISKMTMVDVRQSAALVRRAGRRGISFATQSSNLTMVYAG